jgi:CelD/BcsL family acetyltransferase involved in cellulose biosynthesis
MRSSDIGAREAATTVGALAGGATPRPRRGVKRWQVVRLDGELGHYAADWDALLRRLWGGHPLLDSRFVDGLLRHFGSADEYLCIGKGEDGTDAAMCILRRRSRGIWETFLPSQAPIAPLLMANAAGIDTLIRALPGLALQLDLLCIDDRFGDLLVRNNGRPNATWHALSIFIDLRGGFESYWDGRPTKLRQNLRRYERKLAARGAIRTVAVTDPSEIAAATRRYAAVESVGWKGIEGTAIAPGTKQLDFYIDLLTAFAAEGRTEVHELWLGSAMIASRMMIATENLLTSLKTTYLEEYADCSPSNVLLARVIRQAFDRHKGKSLEFYTNATHDRRVWSTGSQPIRHASFVRYSWMNDFLPSLRAARAGWRTMVGRQTMPSQGDPMAVRVCTQVDELPEDALRLMAQAEEISVECGADWFRNLCASIGSFRDAAEFHVLLRADTAVAVLAVTSRRNLLPREQRIESLANYYTALFAPAIAEGVQAGDLVPLIRSVLASRKRIASVRLAPLDPLSREFTLLREAFVAAGVPLFPYFCFGNWYLPKVDDWSAYFESRSGALRSTLRRMGQRFAMQGGRLEIVSGPERLAAGIAAFVKCYRASWKRQEPHPKFVPGLIELCARRGWLRLGVAWLGQQPVAAQLWIVANGKAEIYKLAHDMQFSRYSPGTLLTAHLLRHVCQDDRVSEVDYLIGDDRYKELWMSRRRERWGLAAYNPLSVGGTVGLGVECLRRLIGTKRPVSGRKAQPDV